MNKEPLAYISTVFAIVINFMGINEVLTTIILLATLGYWIQKNISQYKRNKR
jgi:hypothetical protein